MDDLGSPTRGDGMERAFFGTLPTVWLQHHLFMRAPAFFEWFTVIVHASWFFVPWLAALYVTIVRRERIGSFFGAWLILCAAVLPLFALLPTRPPWMEDPNSVTRIISIKLGNDVNDANPLAAIPSMHIALPMVIALWFFNERWIKAATLMMAYVGLVGFEVVFSGEHYVVDVVAGALIAVPVVMALGAFASMRTRARTNSLSPSPTKTFQPALASQESGQNLLEFALLTPVLLVFIGAIVIFGLAMHTRSDLQQAMREGARQAAVGASLTDVQKLAADNASEDINPSDVAVCYPVDSNGKQGAVGGPVRVYIEKSGSEGYKYTLVPLGGIFKAFGASSVTVTMAPRATARLEKSVASPASCPT